MIQNIIFDIGNVLAGFRWKEYLKELNFDKQICEKIADATVKHPIWNEFDRGLREDEDIINECISFAPEYSNEIQEFFEKIEGIVKEYDYSTPLIQSLRNKGYKVYLLSNYPKTAFQYALKNFSFIPHVDGKLISYEINKIKPEEDIYKALIEQFNLDPKESVFLDDKLENIEAADLLGFKTIHFTSIDDAKHQLDTLGIPVDN
jgi:putative hydrolase of the HAD superfamily